VNLASDAMFVPWEPAAAVGIIWPKSRRGINARSDWGRWPAICLPGLNRPLLLTVLRNRCNPAASSKFPKQALGPGAAQSVWQPRTLCRGSLGAGFCAPSTLRLRHNHNSRYAMCCRTTPIAQNHQHPLRGDGPFYLAFGDGAARSKPASHAGQNLI